MVRYPRNEVLLTEHETVHDDIEIPTFNRFRTVDLIQLQPGSLAFQPLIMTVEGLSDRLRSGRPAVEQGIDRTGCG